MFTKIRTFISAMIALHLAIGQAVAQQPAKNSAFVAFRLVVWKTVHFDDEQKATVHSETLKKIGCDVGSEKHAGHTDVIYRSERWQLLRLDSKEQADQWEKWLAQSSFETLRGKPKVATSSGSSTATIDVKYRLASPRLRHFPKDDERREYVTMTTALGCGVTQIAHDGHTDVKIECPNWMQAEFPSHEVAHAWEAWLQKAGFETEHKH